MINNSRTQFPVNDSHISQIVALLLLAAFNSSLVAQTTAITWGTSKDVGLDFGDEFVRVSSDYSSFSFATGFGSDVAFPTAGPDLIAVLSSFDSRVAPTAASAFDAVASAVAQWKLSKNNIAGYGHAHKLSRWYRSH